MLVVALSLSEQVEKIGAYLGAAAFFGFAVLAILCFSQARELRRLREWAGRAPERAAEMEARVMADAAARQRTPAPAVPRAAPAGAATVATTAGPPAAPAPAAAAAVSTAPPKDGEAATEAPPSAVTAADAGNTTPTNTPGSDAANASDAPAPGATTPPTDPPATPPPAVAPSPGNGAAGGIPALPPRATPVPKRGGTTPPVLPRPAPAAPLRATGAVTRRPTATVPDAPEGRGTGRTAAIVVGVLAALLVLVFAGTRLFGDDPAPKPNKPVTASTATATPDAGDDGDGKTTPPSRAETTVTVLNGTAVPGLAATTADKIEQSGFKRGITKNFSDQARSASLVFYVDGVKSRATEVGKLLRIPASEIRPMDPGAQALAGPDAQVVVVVGSDQTQ